MLLMTLSMEGNVSIHRRKLNVIAFSNEEACHKENVSRELRLVVLAP